MGTRADFYIGRGKDAEWIGSIGLDGFPDSIPDPILLATNEFQFRWLTIGYLLAREDATLFDQGWPWPWDNSQTTDYSYAFDDGKVWATPFGCGWFDPLLREPEEDDDVKKKVPFPDMSAIKKPTLGRRSGLLVIGRKGPIV